MMIPSGTKSAISAGQSGQIESTRSSKWSSAVGGLGPCPFRTSNMYCTMSPAIELCISCWAPSNSSQFI
eukprot:1566940-Rhodomonas_salina.2